MWTPFLKAKAKGAETETKQLKIIKSQTLGIGMLKYVFTNVIALFKDT